MVLTMLSRAITDSVREYRAGRTGALTDCVRDLARPEILGPLLSPAAGEEVLDRAYRHPNGFLKIVLVADSEFQLRLHVWRPGAGSPPPTENVHSHRWDFASAILMGGYRYQEYVADERGEPFLGFRYHGHSDTTSYSLEPTGPTRLRCRFDAHLAAGSSYLLTSDVLHRVVSPPDRTTASIVLQGPHKQQPVDVYAQDAIESGAAVALSPVTRDQVVRELAAVRDLVIGSAG